MITQKDIEENESLMSTVSTLRLNSEGEEETQIYEPRPFAEAQHID